ncbi:hypothetical protein [Leptospira brenneri]|uniref:Dolichyl-phosphate-mannose--protein mannosyltransferase n=1 Tax=Leptospira brenneri TaxID=2023182 RepID=A0A2M9Y1M8_9LEPT|nr:hypothetical protein [Leptospira brenneri]PJZ45471.1 hypothetical protein CH361_10620 [Leptospira brenneri]TGK91964.1 hypothetical protein EHQ30_17435 [Leptospira brenneri]
MLSLQTTIKKAEPYLSILVTFAFVFISFFYLYTGSFLISTKLIRFATLGLLIYFVLAQKTRTDLAFVSLFLFYFSFSNPVPSSDLIPARFLPLWFDPVFDFRFEFLLDKTNPQIITKEDLVSLQGQMTSLPHTVGSYFLVLPYYLVPGTKEILPTYPWTPGFINFSVFKVLSLIHPLIQPMDLNDSSSLLKVLPTLIRLEKFTAALLATITAYLLYLILSSKPFSNTRRAAFVYVFIYALCTSHFSNSSQGLWQHTVIELLIAAILYLLFSSGYNYLRFFLIGCFAAILIYSRPSSIFLLSFPALMILKDIRNYKWFALGGVLSFLLTGIFLGWVNDSNYAHYLGGYSLHRLAYSLVGYSDLFSNSFWKGFLGLTVSPGFGYYIFSPFLVFPFLLFSKITKKALFLSLIIPELLLVLFYAKYVYWEGGHSYGARFLTDINIFSILAFSLIPITIWKSHVLQFMITLCLLFSLYVQYFGASQKEIVSLWNSCYYQDNFTKAIDLSNLPFHPNLKKTNCMNR